VKAVIQHVASGVVTVARDPVICPGDQLGLPCCSCREILLKPVAPWIIDKTEAPAAFIRRVQPIQRVVRKSLIATGIELVRNAEDVAVVLRAIVVSVAFEHEIARAQSALARKLEAVV